MWASAAVSVLITVIVTVQPQLVSVFFGGAALEPLGVALSLAIAALIIPIVEAYKAIMRKIEG